MAKPAPARRLPVKWRDHYQRLIELRDHLMKSRDNLNREALEEQPAFSSHMADAGTDTYDRDFALGILSGEQDAMNEIEQALNRIRNGTYGICELTGEPIEPARLEAIPWTRFDLAAEKELEREGQVKRVGLGPRQTVARSDPRSEEEED